MAVELLEGRIRLSGHASVITQEIEQLEERLRGCLGGRIRSLQLVLDGSGLVLRGRCNTYYAKQLAQHAVMEATEIPLLANEIEVF